MRSSQAETPLELHQRNTKQSHHKVDVAVILLMVLNAVLWRVLM